MPQNTNSTDPINKNASPLNQIIDWAKEIVNKDLYYPPKLKQEIDSKKEKTDLNKSKSPKKKEESVAN
ncbi:MAG: hypothetical protein AAFO07_00305 [Bacteroidota bacterium]